MATMINLGSIPEDVRAAHISSCREEDFKRYVREVINNELFWRDLIQKIQSDSQLESKIKSIMLEFVDKQSSINKQKIVESVRKNIDGFAQTQLPNIVSGELGRQLPAYLNNDYRMKDILFTHSESLNKKLQESATDTLNKLTNEEQYQLVTTSHINNQSLRFDAAISEQLRQNSITFNQQMSSYAAQGNNAISDFIQTSNQALMHFTDFNAKADVLDNRIKKLEEKATELKNENMIQTALITVCAFCAGLYMLLKK